jgi:ribonuclease HII
VYKSTRRTKPSSADKISPSAAKLRLLKRLKCTLKFEKLAWMTGAKLVAGALAIAAVDSARIDQINIYQASRLAMLMAIRQLAPVPDYLLADAVTIDCDLPQRKIIHGDALSASIAAASIIAKVERDRMIAAWDPVFPIYGLASNKGYSTPRHIAALRAHGPSPLHRQSFAPVWNAPIPQEVLSFMLDQAVDEPPVDDGEVVALLAEQ